MRKAVVAVVGRPNVGKSTLFNAIAGKQISIVQDTPGVTRDRIYAEASWLTYHFTLVDTGGIEPVSDNLILKEMRAQAELAIETADVILFVTDVRTGVVDADYEVAEMLRKSKKSIVLCVNKVDSVKKFGNDVYEFYALGLGEPFPVSSANQMGIGDLLEEVVKHFPNEGEEEEEDDRLKIALIGKPNVGKSSLINRLLGEKRVIVSDIAGTTRDAIDTEIQYKGKSYVFIDTAGLRRKGRVTEDIERYSVIRTVSAVDRADICVVLLDATEGITDGDTRIAGIAHESGKGVIIAVNKWDLIEKNDKTMQEFTKKLREKFSYMDYAEILFISAETGQRTERIFELVDRIHENQVLRIKTGVLNEILARATAMKQPPSDKGRRLKLFYITQASVSPPTFVLFVNDRELMHFSYTRYIENQIRENFGFAGTPIRFIIRERGEEN